MRARMEGDEIFGRRVGEMGGHGRAGVEWGERMNLGRWMYLIRGLRFNFPVKFVSL
jgi:hypothetical protein